MEHPQYAQCAVQPGREVKHQRTGEKDPISEFNLHDACMLYCIGIVAVNEAYCVMHFIFS